MRIFLVVSTAMLVEFFAFDNPDDNVKYPAETDETATDSA